MGLSLKFLKEKMARMGFYSTSDYAKLIDVTRQAVHVKQEMDNVPKTKYAGRNWIKYDNGEHAISVYGAPKQPLTPFINFGFVQRLKSLIVGDKVVCDIKNLQDNKVAIRFYNQEGHMLQILADLSTLEIIDDVPDSI